MKEQHNTDFESSAQDSFKAEIHALRLRTIATIVFFGVFGVLLILPAYAAGEYRRMFAVAITFVFIMIVLAIGQIQDEKRKSRK